MSLGVDASSTAATRQRQCSCRVGQDPLEGAGVQAALPAAAAAPAPCTRRRGGACLLPAAMQVDGSACPERGAVGAQGAAGSSRGEERVVGQGKALAWDGAQEVLVAEDGRMPGSPQRQLSFSAPEL